MKSKHLFTIVFVVFMLIGLIACSPAQDNPKTTSSKQLELALGAVRRVKVRFNAQLTRTGQLNELFSGMAQFESNGDNTKPLSYISTNQIAIYLSESKVAMRYGTEKWQELPLADSFITIITRILKGVTTFQPKDFFTATGLSLTSSNLDNSWQSFGTTALDGQQVYSFQKNSTDTMVWNGMFGIVASGISCKKTLTELWVGTANNLPYRVRYTLYLNIPKSTGDSTVEINLYPYDYNEPLNLPIDIPR